MRLTVEEIRAKDKLGMYSLLDDSADQLRRSYEALSKTLKIDHLGEINEVIFTGMGSSATASEIAAEYLREKVKIPIYVERACSLPSFASEKTLAVAVSKSGETVETIKSFKNALKRGCKVICVSCGGDLEKLAVKYGVPHLKTESTPLSRTTTFILVGSILALAKNIFQVKSLEEDLKETTEKMREVTSKCSVTVPLEKNYAKKLANEISGKNIHVLASNKLKVAGLRLIQQLNENCKIGAYYNYLPDALHNYVMQPRGVNDALIVIRGEVEDEYTIDSIKEFKLRAKHSTVNELIGIGSSLLSRISTAILKSDYLSYYLALKLNVDPASTPALTEIKQKLRMKYVADS